MNCSAESMTIAARGKRSRVRRQMPSRRCVLPTPPGPWSTKGDIAPGCSAAKAAAACAIRFPTPTTYCSSVSKGRAGLAGRPLPCPASPPAIGAAPDWTAARGAAAPAPPRSIRLPIPASNWAGSPPGKEPRPGRWLPDRALGARRRPATSRPIPTSPPTAGGSITAATSSPAEGAATNGPHTTRTGPPDRPSTRSTAAAKSSRNVRWSQSCVNDVPARTVTTGPPSESGSTTIPRLSPNQTSWRSSPIRDRNSARITSPSGA